MISEQETLKFTAISRIKNKRWNEGKRADLWVCGFVRLFGSKEIKCSKCGSTCFYTPDNPDLIKKNAEKICFKCVLKHYKKDLNPEQIKILEGC